MVAEARVTVAVDPGPVESAYVVYDGNVIEAGREQNAAVLEFVRGAAAFEPARLVVEKIASYGMPVGEETFQTCVWTGRLVQRWADERFRVGFDPQWHEITRLRVKLALCHHPHAKDSNVRQALLDRFGGKSRAIGSKKARGPLYALSGDMWAALAVAVAWNDINGGGLEMLRVNSVPEGQPEAPRECELSRAVGAKTQRENPVG
ncbi:MAG TPA: hypothetical protein VD948_02955 [Rhodothermales bacterium]|nr:hypothetical protein [Rhodothermales bacterium]